MKKISVINGLRGVAILGVTYRHMLKGVTTPGFKALHIGGFPLFPFTFLANGWVGVNMFFVLSGFVLFLPYAKESREMKSKGDVKSFYLRRARRLMPLYYISTIMSMVFLYGIVHRKSNVIRDVLLMLTAAFNFNVDTFMPVYNPLLWSIGVEILFSLLFPLLVVLERRAGLMRLFIFAAVFSLITRCLGVYFDAYFSVGSPYQNALKDSLAGRLDDFVLGMLICGLYVNRYRSNPLKRKSSIICFLLGVFVLWAGLSLWDYQYLGYISKFIQPFTNNIFHAAFFLIIVSLLSMGDGFVKSLVTNRPIQVIGMMSYSLYMWNILMIYPIINGHVTPLNLTVYLLVLFTFSILTYRYIEFGHKGAGELFLLKARGGATELL